MILTNSTIQQLLPCIIEGEVKCSNDTPLVGAEVFVVPKLNETYTTEQGKFSLSTWLSLPLTLIVAHKNFECCNITINHANQKLLIKLKEK